MRFQLDEQNLQFVLSSFTVNQLLDAVMRTEYIQLPISHELIRALSGFELTTTLLFAVIPELFYNYGPRNVTLGVKPLTGTFLDWKASSRSTTFHARALAKWIVDEDSFDNVTAEVFESILDIDVALSLDINQTTNSVKMQLTNLTLSGFNVTVDNLGGSIKSDQAGILYRLGGIISAIEAVMNAVLANYPINLPEFNAFKYSVKFDYQDSAFGTGIMITPK